LREEVLFFLLLFKNFFSRLSVKRLSIRVDVEWTFSGHGPDRERTGLLGSG
jgi:hypothetical protein